MCKLVHVSIHSQVGYVKLEFHWHECSRHPFYVSGGFVGYKEDFKLTVTNSTCKYAKFDLKELAALYEVQSGSDS